MTKSKVRVLLTEIRKTFGTQQYVAEQLRISRQLLGMYETGVRNPKPRVMHRMEKYFGIPAIKLFPDLFFDQESHKTLQNNKSA